MNESLRKLSTDLENEQMAFSNDSAFELFTEHPGNAICGAVEMARKNGDKRDLLVIAGEYIAAECDNRRAITYLGKTATN